MKSACMRCPRRCHRDAEPRGETVHTCLQHPPEPWEELRPVQLLGVRHETLAAIVVPTAHGQQCAVASQQRRQRGKVAVKVRRHLAGMEPTSNAHAHARARAGVTDVHRGGERR